MTENDLLNKLENLLQHLYTYPLSIQNSFVVIPNIWEKALWDLYTLIPLYLY